MDKLAQMVAMGAAGSGAAEGVYIEDLFSTYLYNGNNSSSRAITNGIDVSGEGGLVWVKRYDGSQTHVLQDTERGTGVYFPISTGGNSNAAGTRITSFNSDGFSVGNDSDVNANAQSYASWTFRKAPGFFDIVTYTGNGTNQDISHNLGSVPGCIIVKSLASSDWVVYHRSSSASPGSNALQLNSTDAVFGGLDNPWADTVPTSTTFRVANVYTGTPGRHTNINNVSYVAYLFAHDEQIFGENADQSVIKCGSYTGNGSTGQTINLGFEPQWLMIKCTSRSGVGYGWGIYDEMRNKVIAAESSNGQFGTNRITFKANGFEHTTGDSDLNENLETYIYIAIRRGPMKTPTDATTVFKQLAYSGSSSAQSLTSGFPGDFFLVKTTSSGQSSVVADKLRGSRKILYTARTDSDETLTGEGISFTNDTLELGTTIPGWGIYNSPSGYSYAGYVFRRAPGFFDVVAYTGDGAFSRNVTHNLGIQPELVIVKSRSNASTNWVAGLFVNSTQYNLWLNSTAANGSASSGGIAYTQFSTTTDFRLSAVGGVVTDINTTAATYIAYLFATLPGVSKVGSYTGSSSDVQVDCGFTAGARFVLIKRTDAIGDWCVFDTARGIVSGNDPLLRLNDTSAEDTGNDLIDPLSSGFTVVGGNTFVNGAGRSYIFLAIA